MGAVHIEYRESVAILTLDNPPVNVLSIDMGKNIRKAIDKVADDDAVLAVIITGSGDKAFMAGADIKEFPRYLTDHIAEEMALSFDDTLNAIHRLGKPTIAALNGLALGGGCEISLACDFRIAEEQVKIGLPETKLGLFPGAGGTQRLPRLIGESKAKEMIFTGEPISAAEACRIGLVNRVVPTGCALQGAIEFAKPFTNRSLASIRLAKRAIDEGMELILDEGLRLEADLFGQVFETKGAREGIQAFLEKRPPKFTHE